MSVSKYAKKTGIKSIRINIRGMTEMAKEPRGYRITKYLCVICAFVMAVSVFNSGAYSDINVPATVVASDEEDELLRVGLEGLYYNKQSITIRNADIVVGYSVNNKYYREFSCDNGTYTIKPFTEKYTETGTYTSYEKAREYADSLINQGITAYPVLKYLGTWTVAKCGQGSSDNYAVLVMGDDGQGFVYTVDDSSKAYPQITAASANSSGVYVVNLGERQYRGRIEIGRYNGASSLKVVNIVPMEKYLYGVVPCEMVYTWHEEALKAQAVCARGYAYTAGFGGDTNLSAPYNLCDTTSSQVYKGYGAEKDTTTAAVDATDGVLVYYNGSPVRTYYSSTSGGSTENVEDVWGTPNGYLRQVSDIYELEPELEPWIKELTADEIEELLAENGISIGNVTDIHPSVMTASGRVYSVEVVGDSKQIITGSKLRKYFSLYSTKYKVIKYSDNPDYVAVLTADGQYALDIADSYIAADGFQVSKASGDIEQFVVMTADNLINYPAKAPDNEDTYYIAGMGYGHGIGMSQSGAKGMAEAGFTYEEILKHYFTGVEVKN